MSRTSPPVYYSKGDSSSKHRRALTQGLREELVNRSTNKLERLHRKSVCMNRWFKPTRLIAILDRAYQIAMSEDRDRVRALKLLVDTFYHPSSDPLMPQFVQQNVIVLTPEKEKEYAEKTQTLLREKYGHG